MADQYFGGALPAPTPPPSAQLPQRGLGLGYLQPQSPSFAAGARRSPPRGAVAPPAGLDPDFAEWLGETLAAHYGADFAEHGFDSVEVLGGLTDAQLEDMLESYVRIDRAGHRMLFLNRLAELRGGDVAPRLAASASPRMATPVRPRLSVPPAHTASPAATNPMAAQPRRSPAVAATLRHRRDLSPPQQQQQQQQQRRGTEGGGGTLFDPLDTSQYGAHIAPPDELDRAHEGPVRSPSPEDVDDAVGASGPWTHHDGDRAAAAGGMTSPPGAAKRPKRQVGAVQVAASATKSDPPLRRFGSALRAKPAAAKKPVVAAVVRGGRGTPPASPTEPAPAPRTATPTRQQQPRIAAPSSSIGSARNVNAGHSAPPPQRSSTRPQAAVRLEDRLEDSTPTAASPPPQPISRHGVIPPAAGPMSPVVAGRQESVGGSDAYDSLISMLHSAPALAKARAANSSGTTPRGISPSSPTRGGWF